MAGADNLARSITSVCACFEDPFLAPSLDFLPLVELVPRKIGVGQRGFPIRLKNSRFGKQTLTAIINLCKFVSFKCHMLVS